MLKTIKESINSFCQTIHVKTTTYFYTRGLKKEQKRKDKEQKRYEKAVRNFNFIVNPFDTPERYVILQGNLYRVVFKPEGVSITNGTGDFVECKLTCLKVLKHLEGNQ